MTLLHGGRFEEWPGTVDEVLARIEAGWMDVGTPHIGDVVWLIGKRGTP